MVGTAGEGGVSSCPGTPTADLHDVFCLMPSCWVGASPLGTASSSWVGQLRVWLLSLQGAPLVGPPAPPRALDLH